MAQRLWQPTYPTTRRFRARSTIKGDLRFSDVTEGTVYTILLRLEKRGLVDSSKQPSEVGPPRKFYELNAAGRESLATFWLKWGYLSSRFELLKDGGQ